MLSGRQVELPPQENRPFDIPAEQSRIKLKTSSMNDQSRRAVSVVVLGLTLTSGVAYYVSQTQEKEKEYDLPSESKVIVESASPFSVTIGTGATYVSAKTIEGYERWRNSIADPRDTLVS
jgi:hypothetical protein